MIQINLVPDVKQEMLRAQKMRNVTISMAILVGVISGGVVGVLALVLGTQAVTEGITDGQIKSEYNKLSSITDINNSLTLQNQLKNISSINDTRSMNSRLLDVLTAINPPVPNDVKIARVSLDPTQKILSIEGSAVNGYTAVDIFRKTILNTTVAATKAGESTAFESPLTSEVSIQETSYGEDSSGARVVRFTLQFVYPDGMFDNTLENVRVNTPSAKMDVTDSKTRVPDSMFSQAAKDVEEDQ